MLTHVLLVLMVQQAVSTNINVKISVPIDDCIPTGESKGGLIDPCEGSPVPAMNTKCCSPKDKSHCVQTYMSCGNMGTCTCKPEEENDDCIPTGQTQSDIVKDCDGIKPDKEVKCCSAKDQISCVYTWMLCDNVRRCTCKAKEDNDDGCIPTGESKAGIVDDIDGHIIMKCCSSRADISCTSTKMSGHNEGECTCK